MEIIEITEAEAQDRLDELVDSTESGTVYCIVRPDGSKVMMVPADPSKIQFDDDDIALYTQQRAPKTEVILERYPYRYIRRGTIELNGMPDYRIQSLTSGTSAIKTCICLTTLSNLTMPWKTLSIPSG